MMLDCTKERETEPLAFNQPLREERKTSTLLHSGQPRRKERVSSFSTRHVPSRKEIGVSLLYPTRPSRRGRDFPPLLGMTE